MASAVFLAAIGCTSGLNAERAKTAEAETQAAIREFQGVWKPVNATLGGVSLPPAALAGTTLKISGEKYEVTVQGEPAPDRGISKIDASVTPKRMSTTSTNGPNSGKTFLAIYEFQDTNTVRICYDFSAMAYPREFESPPGLQFYLVTYKRQ